MNHASHGLSEWPMDTWSRATFGGRRRFFILAAVISGHVLLLVLLAQVASKGQRRTVEDAQSRTVLMLIEPRRVQPPPEIIPPTPRPITRAPELPRPIDRAPEPASPISRAPEPEEKEPEEKVEPPPQQESAPGAIDWRAAGELAARAAIEADTKGGVRKFGEPRAKPQEQEKVHEFEWSPKPPVVGFVGPLPFLRLGKRCIIILPFFNCGVGGQTTPPDGEVFEHMGDPNASRSSVPEPQGNAVPEPPK